MALISNRTNLKRSGRPIAPQQGMRHTGTVVAITLGALLILLAFSGFGIMSGMMNRSMGPGTMSGYNSPIGSGYSWIGVAVSMTFPILVLGGVVALIVWFARNADHGIGPADTRDSESPIQILKARYARGEITKEQFEAMRHDLES